MDTLYLVVPCYNEEEVLPESARVMRQKLHQLILGDKISPESRLLLVDDGSRDGTWPIIQRLCRENDLVCGIRLGHNRGHQNALMAGLVTAANYADFTISMDADLQDDIDAIDEMVEKYSRGCPIVCGVRRSRDTDSFFKRVSARAFYTALNMSGAKTVYDHADFRLLSRGAVNRLCRFGTEDLYIRGLITRLDLPLDKVYYDRFPRTAGESKYSLKSMLALAKRGFESKKLQPAESPVIGELYIDEVLIS